METWSGSERASESVAMDPVFGLAGEGIAAGDELRWDYGSEYWAALGERPAA